MYQETMTQGVPPMVQIVPANTALNANAVTTGALDMSKFKRAKFVLQIGAVTGSGTVDGQLQSSANSNFNVVHNITNSQLTQITSSGANTIVTMEVRSDQVTQQNAGDRYVRAAVTVLVNSVVIGCIGYGGESIQKPGNQYVNTSVVTQQVVVNT